MVQTGFTLSDGSFVSVQGTTSSTKGTVGGYSYVITTLKRKGEGSEGYSQYDAICVNTRKTVDLGAWNIWDDNKNADRKRPNTASFHLLRNGVDLTDQVLTLTNQTAWQMHDMSSYDVLWQKLPLTNDDGSVNYTYSVALANAQGVLIEGSGAYNADYTVTRQSATLNGTAGFRFDDYHNATDLTFGKLAADTQKGTRTALSGAVFGIYTDAGCTNLVTKVTSGTSVGTQESKAGQVRVHGLLQPNTTYYVKELASSVADLNAGSDTDNIGEDPTVYTVTFKGQETAGLLTSSGTVVVNIVDRVYNPQQVQAVIEKKDSKGNLIGGFVYQITDKYGNPVRDMNGNIIQNVVTEAGKPLEIKGLKDGEYYLREVSAPQGYTVSSQPMTLSIDNNAIAAAAEQNGNTATVLQPGDAPSTIVSAETEHAKTVKNTANVGATGNAVTLAPGASTTTPAAPAKKNNEKCQFAAAHILGLATYIAVVVRNGWIAR